MCCSCFFGVALLMVWGGGCVAVGDAVGLASFHHERDTSIYRPDCPHPPHGCVCARAHARGGGQCKVLFVFF